MRSALLVCGALVVGILLGSGVVVGQEVEKPKKAEKDCHGPLYYKQRQQDKEQRQAEEARVEVAAFVERIAPTLFAAQRAEIESIMAARQKDYLACVASTKKPSPLCVAMASGNARPCQLLGNADERGPCLQLSMFAAALKKKDASPCAGIDVPDIRRVCEFVASGNYTCGELGEGPAASVCTMLAGGDTTKLDELPAEVKGPLHWLLALTRKQISWCEKLASVEEVEACGAAVSGREEMCRPVRPMVEHLDNDYSCRKILGRHSVRPGGDGKVLNMLFVSPYKGKASCELAVRLSTPDGKEVTQKLGVLAIPGSGHFVEKSHPIGSHRLLEVISGCTWDPESSRIDLRRE